MGRSQGWKYLGAAVVLIVALVARALLHPTLGGTRPYLTLVPAVILVLWFAGAIPAALVAVVGFVVSTLMFVPITGDWGSFSVSGLIGAIAFFLFVTVVIAFGTVLRRAREKAERAERVAAEIAESRRVTLASIGDGVITTDPAGRITFMNAEAERLSGWQLGEAAGRPIDQVFRIVSEVTRTPAELPVQQVLETGAVVGLANHTILIAHDGTERAIDDSAAPIRNAAGEIAGVVLVFHDVSSRRSTESQLRESVTELQRNQSLMQHQAALLEGVAHGRPRDDLLAIMCGAVNELAEGPRAAVLLINEDGDGVREVIAPDVDPELRRSLVAQGDRAPACLHTAPILGRDGRTIGAVVLVAPMGRTATPWEERLTSIAASIATVLFERDRAQQALERNQERLADEAGALVRLHAASRRLWSARSVSEGLEEMLDAVITLLSADMGNFQMMDPVRRRLMMAAHRGFNSGYLDLFAEVKGDETSACARVLRSGERVIIEDVETDELYAPYRPMAREIGYRTVVATPLVGRDGTTLGVLSAHFREPRSFDEQELRRLDLFIRQAVDFVERVAVETRLRDADRRKNEFLATLAHELRNPLAPMRSAIGLLRLSDAPDARERALDIMDRQVGQMVRLIDDLMDVGRITRDKLELRKEPVELATVLRHVVESAVPMLHGARQVLDVAISDAPMPLLADPARLAQVFGNLLTNASKYSAEGRRIGIEAVRQGEEVVVRVRDEGTGIAPDKLEAVFDMFTQVEPAARRSHGGLGIGLTLARRLAALHGGTLTASSPGRGQGSTFEVRLPVAAAEPEAAPRGPTRHLPSSRRVLVVDDNRDAAMTLAALLQQAGHDTEVAYDGRQAILMAASSPPEVVVLDLGMPGMNGYDVCRRLRAEPWAAGMRIIALTGWGQEADKRKSRAAGFDHHLVKPVTTEELLNAFEPAPTPHAGGSA